MSDKQLALTVRKMSPAVYEEQRAVTDLKARFQDDLKNSEAARQFLGVCLHYQLDPFLGEIYPYHGRVYVGEPGWREKIGKHAKGQLAGITSRQATQEEREQYQIQAGDWFAVATVTRRLPTGEMFTTESHATLRKAELHGTKHLPADVEPWAMAEKRARVRGLRTAFGDTLKGHIPAEIANTEYAGETIDVEPRAAQPALIEPTPEEASETIKQTAAARQRQDNQRQFWARVKEMGGLQKPGGAPSQERIHKLLKLPCGKRIHDQGPKAGCHALKDWIQEMVRGGKSEAEAWETATLAVENAYAGLMHASGGEIPEMDEWEQHLRGEMPEAAEEFPEE